MMKIICFEGGIGCGKTRLVNYFSNKLKIGKILEKYNINPFLREFYKLNSNVNLETEITFLLIHYYQMKNAIKVYQDSFLISDFSIEKDLVFAKLNLDSEEFGIFKNLYEYIIKQVGIPDMVIYLNLNLKILKRRIFQRGRSYELNADPNYFTKYNDRIREFFKTATQSKIFFFEVDDLKLNQNNEKLKQIERIILEVMK